MPVSRAKQEQILLAVAIAAAVFIHISIAASQIFLGLGIVLLLVLHRRLPFPRIWVPLACFLAWTIAADLLCPDPWGGRAQIRKFFDFLFIPLLYGVFVGQFARTRTLLAGWIAAATASGAWGLVQYVMKYQQARHSGRDFYVAYLERRITGFESHWMTFGALQLSVLSLLLAHFFFSGRRFPLWVYGTAVILSAAILLGWTRGIWIASIPALIYLVGAWRPKMIVAIPIVFLLGFAAAPRTTKARLLSLFEPHGDTDSNRHRIVTFRTGVEMIKAHPWFGIGPEEIGRQFSAYVPSDVVRPLPVGYYGHLHNIYVQYAAERGLPGVLCMLWFVGLAVWDFITAIVRLKGRPSLELAVLHGAIAVTIGILVGGIFEYNLGDSEVLMMFVSVIAIGYAAAAQARPAAASASS
jgi:O-antigen ligase